MPTENPTARLEDILDSIDAIRGYMDGVTLAAFQSGGMPRDAVERRLTIISEAASKLGLLADRLAPDVPWKSIRNLGNFLRHEYDSLEVEVLWSICTKELEPLESACRDALAKLKD